MNFTDKQKEFTEKLIELIKEDNSTSPSGNALMQEVVDLAHDINLNFIERDNMLTILQFDLMFIRKVYGNDLALTDKGFSFTSFSALERSDKSQRRKDSFSKFWIPGLAVLIAVVAFIWNINQSNANSDLENRVQKLEKRMKPADSADAPMRQIESDSTKTSISQP